MLTYQPQNKSYSQIARFFVIKSVDEDNIHKVTIPLNSLLNLEYGAPPLKEIKSFRKHLRKPKTLIRSTFSLALMVQDVS